MRWRLIIEDFGPNIQHIYGVDNIVSDMLIRLTYASADTYDPSTVNAQCDTKELLAISREENKKYRFLLNILNLHREWKKETRKINSKLSAYISDWGSGYSKKALDKVEIICYKRKSYMPQTLQRRVLDWYHFYLKHPGGSRLAKIIQEVWYWIGLVTQEYLYDKLYRICQKFKNRNTFYERLPPKNIAGLKQWNTVHVYMKGSYGKYIRKQHLCGSIMNNAVSLICMKIIDPATGWFEISKVPIYDLSKVTEGNNEYIDKSSTRVSQCLIPHG